MGLLCDFYMSDESVEARVESNVEDKILGLDCDGTPKDEVAMLKSEEGRRALKEGRWKIIFDVDGKKYNVRNLAKYPSGCQIDVLRKGYIATYRSEFVLKGISESDEGSESFDSEGGTDSEDSENEAKKITSEDGETYWRFYGYAKGVNPRPDFLPPKYPWDYGVKK